MIDIEPHPEGVLLPVRASAGAKENSVRGEQDGALKVSVTQAPEKGKANKALIQVLSKELGLKQSAILLYSGETTRVKKFLVLGIATKELRRRLERFSD